MGESTLRSFSLSSSGRGNDYGIIKTPRLNYLAHSLERGIPQLANDKFPTYFSTTSGEAMV